MAESFTPLTLANINGQVSSAVTSINQNFATLQSLLLDVLSLSGVSPNAMQSNLDMNQFNIINLPYATAASEPITLGQAMLLTGTLTLPVNPTFSTLQINNGSWINTYLPGEAGFTPAVIGAAAGQHWSALLTATRSSYTTTIGDTVIADTAFALNDNLVQLQNVFARYTQGVILAGSTYELFINEESSIENLAAASVTMDPYGNYGPGGTAGAAINLRLDSGIGTASNNISCYLQMTNNGGKALNGIIVGSNALDTSVGGYAGALTMATNHGVEWFAQSGTRSWRIFTNSASNNSQGQMVLGNGTFDLFLGSGNAHAFAVTAGGAGFLDGGAWGVFGISTVGLNSPLITGGTLASSSLVIESTNGVGTSDSIVFKTGSQATCLTLATTGTATFNKSMVVSSATATTAGGAVALVFGTTAGFGIYYGSGLPTISAAQGSIYLRSDGSSGSTRLYVNSSGSTTWVNITSAS